MSRCQPVSWTNSSRTFPFVAVCARAYRVAVPFVTALRWLNVNSMHRAVSQPARPPAEKRRYAEVSR